MPLKERKKSRSKNPVDDRVPVIKLSPLEKKTIDLSSDEEEDYLHINKKPRLSYHTLDYFDNLSDDSSQEESTETSDSFNSSHRDDEKKIETYNDKGVIDIKKEEINFLNSILNRKSKNNGELIKPRRTTAYIAGMIEDPTRDTIVNRRDKSVKWTIEQDSDLISMALLSAAKGEDMRSTTVSII